jgi:curli biogenesis system outer membrane secretion channel CsgG
MSDKEKPMKRMVVVVGLVLGVAAGVFGQNTFEAALNEAVEDIREKVPSNATVAYFDIPAAVMAEQSAVQLSVQLSDYLLAELGSKLVNTGGFKVLERQKINVERVKASFDASGYVSDESAQGIGHFLGAEYVVIGSLKAYGQQLQMYVETVKVAQKVSSYSKSISRNELSAFYSEQAWSQPQPASTSGRTTYTTSNTGV